MAKRTLALDIQDDGINWVLIRSGLRNVAIEKSGRLSCRVDGVYDSDAVAVLKALRDSLYTPGSACIAAIASRGLFARNIAVPFRDKRKVRQILPLELEATLPVAVDELFLDFQTNGNDGTPTALTVAMPKAQIASHLQLLREAGLDPMLVTFSGLPAATLLAAGPHGEKVSLIVDGDARHCTLFLVGSHQILFVRSWSPPTTDTDSADKLKRAIDQTVEAVSQVLPDTPKVHTIYLTQHAARNYAPERVAAIVDYPVEALDIKNSTRNALAGVLADDRGHGALALGLYEPLAERGLNLFRPTFPLKRFLQQNKKRFIQTGILATILMTLFIVNIYLDIRRTEKHANFLKTETEAILKRAFPETRNIVNPVQQMIIKLREMHGYDLVSTSGPQAAQIDILNTISRALPPKLDIHVSQLVSGPERVQISGTTATFETVNAANEFLEKADLFTKITIVSANMDQKANRVRFKLAADLRRQP